MYDKCVYPSNWSPGVIVPVPKKGDNSDVNNYRGITLTGIFSFFFISYYRKETGPNKTLFSQIISLI